MAISVSNRETASGQMTLIQAVSLGGSVVATRCIGTGGYVRHGENGWVVSMGDVEEWRFTLHSILYAAAERQWVATAALCCAQERFTDRAGTQVVRALAQELCPVKGSLHGRAQQGPMERGEQQEPAR
ncbi:glycosyltransferase [Pyxidicoccus xibeiensis]|uniref:glycosyltransferase n=1 Tax=Pyxidicoccus xibeiensis TaxID=2906759 RepID=UPI0020A7900A|nr:hypothetical protein [Pyxidicoccus xibeiensis]MCP3137434.1 hypothetical protein [Pyxidicoccus xibeiensis]